MKSELKKIVSTPTMGQNQQIAVDMPIKGAWYSHYFECKKSNGQLATEEEIRDSITNIKVMINSGEVVNVSASDLLDLAKIEGEEVAQGFIRCPYYRPKGDLFVDRVDSALGLANAQSFNIQFTTSGNSVVTNIDVYADVDFSINPSMGRYRSITQQFLTGFTAGNSSNNNLNVVSQLDIIKKLIFKADKQPNYMDILANGSLIVDHINKPLADSIGTTEQLTAIDNAFVVNFNGANTINGGLTIANGGKIELRTNYTEQPTNGVVQVIFDCDINAFQVTQK